MPHTKPIERDLTMNTIIDGNTMGDTIRKHSADGKFFTATFTTKNGKKRVMNCRTGVHKYHKGGNNNAAKYPHLVTVYDVHAMGYRNIDARTIERLAIHGQIYTVKKR